MVAVYLSDLVIQAVEGQSARAALSGRVCEAVLPVGLMSSGVVEDPERMSAFLREFWSRNRLPARDVVLVAANPQLVNKTVEVPSGLSETRHTAFVSHEFTDLGRGNDTAFGCWTLEEKKQQKRLTQLVTGAERGYLRLLSQVFSDAGIKLSDIVSELTGVLSVLLGTKQLRGGTCIVQYWNGASLTNVLLADGSYVYSNSNMISYEPDTPAFAVESARQISQLLQFMKAQNMTAVVEQVYLAGVSGDSYELCVESVTQMNPALMVDPLPGVAPGCRTLAAAGAVDVRCGKQSLLRQVGRDREVLEQKAKLRKRFAPVIVLACIAAIVCTVFYGTWLFYHTRLTGLQKYNSDPLMVKAVTEFNALQEENDVLTGRIESLKADCRAIDSYPAPSSRINKVFERCAKGLVEISVASYDAGSGVISTVTTAEKVENINSFAAILAGEDIFSDVNYTGYSYNAATDRWSVNVVCTLAPEAGK